MNVLLIDNYDSFTHNLAQLVGMCGGSVDTHRNNRISIEDIQANRPSHIILSPGPGHPKNPRDFGVCTEIIQQLGPHIPILGVCLGHQGIVHVLGGEIVRAPAIVHGKTSQIRHNGDGIFAQMPPEFEAMRYHSWIAKRSSIPRSLTVTAETDDGLVMGVQHQDWPLSGVQFHPESIGTPTGETLIRNFLLIERTA